ncbi:MAG: hypothetical protein AAGG75_24475 [Bacteroidota bacterium]
MQILKELVELVSKQSIKRIEIMGNPSNYSSKMRDLYEGIHSGELETDAQAALQLYTSSPDHVNYKKLKYRLQKRLINTVFFIDTSKSHFDEAARAYYTCHRANAAVEILLGRAARTAAIDLAHKTLNMAIKFEFTDICFSIAKRLRRHYGSLGRDLKKFEYYNDLIRYYTKLQQAEMLAEEYAQRLYLYSTKSRIYSDSMLSDFAVQFSDELKEKMTDVNSSGLYLSAYQVHTIRYELTKDHENLLKLQDEIIEYMESKRYSNKRFLALVFIRQVTLYTALRDFENGAAATEKCLNLIGRKIFNSFAVQQTFIQLCLRTQHYQRAYETFCTSTQMKEYKTLPGHIKETWVLLEAYVNFLIQIGKIDTINPEYQLRRFRMSKFLNEVPDFSMNKRGQNIPILIIQLLFLLLKKQYDTVWDRVEALNAYCYRYLRRDYTFRSNCFIKMLLLMPKAGFHKERVIRRAQTLLQKLAAASSAVIDSSVDVELIPYEVMWNYITELLENKVYNA